MPLLLSWIFLQSTPALYFQFLICPLSVHDILFLARNKVLAEFLIFSQVVGCVSSCFVPIAERSIDGSLFWTTMNKAALDLIVRVFNKPVLIFLLDAMLGIGCPVNNHGSVGCLNSMFLNYFIRRLKGQTVLALC